MLQDKSSTRLHHNMHSNWNAHNKVEWFSDVDLKLFFRMLWVLDPDPTWLAKGSGFSSGSDPKYLLFHNANHFKDLFMAF
jgi:hypothetical protein